MISGEVIFPLQMTFKLASRKSCTIGLQFHETKFLNFNKAMHSLIICNNYGLVVPDMYIRMYHARFCSSIVPSFVTIMQPITYLYIVSHDKQENLQGL